MSRKLTDEQEAAINAQGKVIVSASAGSGKTFVMIKKLCNLIENGGDLDEILAVTFTKKAAVQMKKKLSDELVDRLATAEGEKRAKIKEQLGKISSADISTIHSFCAHLVRTYFYALDVDSAFGIIAADDAQAIKLKFRAMDNLFDALYESEDKNFKLVLSCLKRKRSDDSVKSLILEAYNAVRNVADYDKKLQSLSQIYSEEGFNAVCAAYCGEIAARSAQLKASLESFAADFSPSYCPEKYLKIFEEMCSALDYTANCSDLFAPFPPLVKTRCPDKAKAAAAGDEADLLAFINFRDGLKKKYDKLKSGLGAREEEYAVFMQSGELAVAFAGIVTAFDAEYTAVKREESVLDYNDLEHLTLRLLNDDGIREQINAKYKYVFVDEYQDVNPVQERIITQVGAGSVFTVGDVKQAIYGFRGSKSVFFSQKYETMKSSDGALKLPNNFRSSDAVLDFVNDLFSDIMTKDVCGFNYKGECEMVRGGRYPSGSGSAELHVFGKDEKECEGANGIYSVTEHSLTETGHTREGLAVLEIVKRELTGQHYDIEKGRAVDTQPGDICILTRKRADKSATGIVAALTDAGYSVAGAKEANLCKRAEIKEMLDILSLIDNCQQDIPLATALLSPVGNLTRDELARIRISQLYNKSRPSFRECMVEYAHANDDELAYKIIGFFKKINDYRRLSDVLGAAQLIEKILSDTGLGARYCADGGDKLAAIKRLEKEAYSATGELPLSAFLQKIKAGGNKIAAEPSSTSDSIKVMTMHSSKGLEFPVVIIADISASFKGRDYSDMPFDEDYGFSPKCYYPQTKLQRTTILRRLCDVRAKRENIKNEFNLFYVACTRAMCNLHIMCGDAGNYDKSDVLDADCYADMFDVNAYCTQYMPKPEEISRAKSDQIIISSPDENVYKEVSRRFMRPYAHADSVELPVKSSASQLLKSEEEDYFAENVLFGQETTDENATGAERGTAYHRFLQLCDFNVKDQDGIRRETDSFVGDGFMSPEQAALLSVDNLVKILSMPAFSSLGGVTTYREREFLCRLPANAVLDTRSEDDVLVQGAIDLLAIGPFGTAVIDYKYCKFDDDYIVKHYAPQLALYKKAVAKILHVAEDSISTTIINIFSCREIKIT